MAITKSFPSTAVATTVNQSRAIKIHRDHYRESIVNHHKPKKKNPDSARLHHAVNHHHAVNPSPSPSHQPPPHREPKPKRQNPIKPNQQNPHREPKPKPSTTTPASPSQREERAQRKEKAQRKKGKKKKREKKSDEMRGKEKKKSHIVGGPTVQK